MTWQFKRKIVSRILIFLLLIGVLTVGLRILPPVNALGWEVDPGGDRDFTTIQEAIDNADIGITDRIIVFPSIYNENINVTKPWKITADDPTETIIHGNGSYHTVTISANNTKIEGFTIEYGMSPYSGVFLNGISNSHITGNIISMNGIGITIAANSTDIFIENNSLFFNQVGMRASGENTSVAHNRIKDNLGGVELNPTSSYFTLINNTIVLNQGGVRVFGSSHRIEKNNISLNYINGMYLTGENHKVINNNVTLNSDTGINIHLCHSSIIYQNKIEQNVKYGIRLSNSSNNEMSYNYIGHMSSDYQQKGISLSLSNSNIIKDNLIMNNAKSGVYLENSSHNTILANRIVGNDINAIDIKNSQENNISINNIEWNNIGVSLANATYNSIASNRLHRNHKGILMLSSNFNKVKLNNISGNGLGSGLCMKFSEKNTLEENSMEMNAYNFGVEGSELSHYIHDIPITNTVEGNRVYYLINQSNINISRFTFPNMGYIAIINSTAISVKGFLEQSKNLQGMAFVWTTNSEIEDLILTGNFYGLYIVHSSNITIKTSKLDHNFYGLYITNSNNITTLRSGVINNEYGVYSLSSHHTAMIDNGIVRNEYGIRFSTSESNIVTHNNIKENRITAIGIGESSANTIYNNNFADTRVITVTGFTPNNWNHTDVGNYWHGYEGEPPYTIDDYNMDYHLLDHPVVSSLVGDCNWDGVVNIFDVVFVCEAYNSEPGDSNWDPYLDLNKDWKIDIFDVVLTAQNYNAVWD